MYEIFISMLKESDVSAFELEYNIFKEVHEDDECICTAFGIARLFHYNNANTRDSKLKIMYTLYDKGIDVTDKTLLALIEDLLMPGAYENDKLEDTIALAKAFSIEKLIPLGYVSEEVMRKINLHERVLDEDVESYIDSIIQCFTNIFWLKTDEMKMIATRSKTILFSKIEDIVAKESDLNLMVQIKEISKYILDWRV